MRSSARQLQKNARDGLGQVVDPRSQARMMQEERQRTAFSPEYGSPVGPKGEVKNTQYIGLDWIAPANFSNSGLNKWKVFYVNLTQESERREP